jgi:hypothetical protein
MLVKLRVFNPFFSKNELGDANQRDHTREHEKEK